MDPFTLIAIAVSVISVGVSYSASKKAREAAEKNKGVLLNKESNIDGIPAVLGTRRLGGTRVFIATKDTPGSDTNEWLYVCLVLCEGEVDQISDLLIDDIPETDGRFTVDGIDLVEWDAKTGSDSQTASLLLFESGAQWTVNHRLQGIAYLGLKFRYNTPAKLTFGIPEVTALVRGDKNIYDPRTDTYGYTENMALCLLHALRNERWGKGLPVSATPTATWADMADLCDTSVPSYAGGPDIAYLTCNYVWDTDKRIFDNLEEMIFAARAFLPFSQGGYHLSIDGSVSLTGVPVLTPPDFHDTAIMTGSSKNDRYNRVTVKFPNPDNNWQDDVAIWPPAGSADDVAWLAEDDGERLHWEVEVPTITDYYQALELARILVIRSRNAIRYGVALAPEHGLDLVVGDLCRITDPELGWDEKPFQVEDVAIDDETLLCGVALLEFDGTIYPWEDKDQQLEYADTNLPNPYDIGPPVNLTLTETTTLADDGSILPAWLFEFDPPPDGELVRDYEVQWASVSGGEEIDDGLITDGDVEEVDDGLITDEVTEIADEGKITAPVGDGEEPTEYQARIITETRITVESIDIDDLYYIRVRARNAFAKSEWATINGTAYGDQTAPAAPSNPSAIGVLGGISLNWINPSDSDFKQIHIYESELPDPTTFERIVTVQANSYTRPGLAYNATRYYFMVAEDYSENLSEPSGIVSAASLGVETGEFVQEINNIFITAGVEAIPIVTSLPPAGSYVGQHVYLNVLPPGNGLYRWDGAALGWTNAVMGAGSITAENIVAGTITGGLLAAAGIITTAAQISAAVIEAVHIVDGAILNAAIGNAEIDTLKLAGNAVTVPVYDGSFTATTVLTTTDLEAEDVPISIAGLDVAEETGVIITAGFALYPTDGTAAVIVATIKMNGTPIESSSTVVRGDGVVLVVAGLAEVGNGAHDITVDLKVGTGGAATKSMQWDAYIVAMAGKR